MAKVVFRVFLVARHYLTPLILLLLTTVSIVASQQQALCCSNAVYSFTINLELSCADTNVAGFGIEETSCMTTLIPPFNEEGILLESIRKIDIYEISPTFGLISRRTFEGPLLDGYSFNYQSMMEATGVTPNGVQLVVTAETSGGSPVYNIWGITFAEACILPVLSEGDRIGWTNVSLTCSGLYDGGDRDDSDTTTNSDDEDISTPTTPILTPIPTPTPTPTSTPTRPSPRPSIPNRKGKKSSKPQPVRGGTFGIND